MRRHPQQQPENPLVTLVLAMMRAANEFHLLTALWYLFLIVGMTAAKQPKVYRGSPKGIPDSMADATCEAGDTSCVAAGESDLSRYISNAVSKVTVELSLLPLTTSPKASGKEGKARKRRAKLLENKLKAVLSVAIHPQVLRTILEANLRFVMPNIKKSSLAGYSDNFHAVFFNERLGDKEIGALGLGFFKDLVSDELFSAGLCAKTQGGGACAIVPNWKQYKKPIAKGLKSIRKLYDNLVEEGWDTAHMPHKLIDMMASYHPKRFEIIKDGRVFKIWLQHNTKSIKKVSKNLYRVPAHCSRQLFPSPNLSILAQNEFYMSYHSLQDGGVRLGIQFVRPQASNQVLLRGFVCDILHMWRTAFDEGGRYRDATHRYFATHGEAYIVSEQLSFLEQFPLAIRRVFFRGVCDLLSEFHGVEDYCTWDDTLRLQ